MCESINKLCSEITDCCPAFPNSHWREAGQLCESILGSISAKHPRFRPFVARVCPSTPHSVTSNQGGQVWYKCYSGGSEWIGEQRMDPQCARGKHGLWSPLAPHILVAPGLIELQAFDDHTFQSNTYMDCVNPRIDCVNSNMKHTFLQT